ncbi:MAG: rhomboid family intramembrane serine protease [Myxococcota bacterium]
MRHRPAFAAPTPGIKFTLGFLLVVWVVLALLYQFTAFGPELFRALVLDPSGVLEGKVWTLLTWVLVDDLTTPFSLLLTCLLFFFFGPELERRWGIRRLLVFYALTALAGGFVTVATWLVGLPSAMGMGAQGVGLALMVAWALTFPDREVMMYFVLPLRGVQLIWIAVGLGVLRAISVAPSGVAADFGAMGMAWLLVSGLWRTNRMRLWWDKFLVALRLRKPPRLYVVPKGDSRFDVH